MIQYCPMTGLLFVHGVAISRETLTLIQLIDEYGTEMYKQFKFQLVIIDEINESKVKVTRRLAEEIMQFVKVHDLKLSPNEDFDSE